MILDSKILFRVIIIFVLPDLCDEVSILGLDEGESYDIPCACCNDL